MDRRLFIQSSLVSMVGLCRSVYAAPKQRTCVVGIGGNGRDMLNHAIKSGLSKNDAIFVDTGDYVHGLGKSESEMSLIGVEFAQLYECGRQVEIAEKVLAKEQWKIRRAIDRYDRTILLVDLSHGIASAMASLIARFAAENETPSTVIASTPIPGCSYECQQCSRSALRSITRDAEEVIVVDLKSFEICPATTLHEVIAYQNEQCVETLSKYV